MPYHNYKKVKKRNYMCFFCEVQKNIQKCTYRSSKKQLKLEQLLKLLFSKDDFDFVQQRFPNYGATYFHLNK